MGKEPWKRRIIKIFSWICLIGVCISGILGIVSSGENLFWGFITIGIGLTIYGALGYYYGKFKRRRDE